MDNQPYNRTQLVSRSRWAMGLFIIALVISGVTAFPLLWEMELAVRILGIETTRPLNELQGLHHWIAFVQTGLQESYAEYPFIAYGTDWLAFAHLVLAVFFIGPLREPDKHDWILISGLIACGGVLLLAMIAGPIRGIPIYWRLLDCSFGIIGAVPLAYCLALSRRIQAGDAESSE